MKRICYFLVILSAFSRLTAQNPSLLITDVAGFGMITCAHPTLNLAAGVSNYNNGGIFTFNWVGPNATYTGSNVYITAPGNYVITALNTVTGFSLSTVYSVQSNTTAPTSTLSPINQTISCLGSAVTVSASTTLGGPYIGIEHSFYSPNGGLFFVNGPNVVYSPFAPGTYTHVLVDGSNGCAVTKTFVVTSSTAFPAFTVASPQNYSVGCGSQSVAVINISSLQMGPLSYTLLSAFSPPNYTTTPIITYTIANPGTYSVIVKDDATGCISKIPITITQNILNPDVTISSFPNSSTLTCNLTTVTLQAFPGGVTYIYNWVLPANAGLPTANSVTVSATANVTNSIAATGTIIATDPVNGCITIKPFQVYQNLFPPNAVISSSTSVLSCTASGILLANGSTKTSPPAFFSPLGVPVQAWYGPAPQQSLTASSIYTASTPGIYTMTVQDLNNGCMATATTVITSIGYPVLTPNIYCFNPSVGASVAITAGLAGPASNFTYLWAIPSPTANISGATTRTLTTNALGIYTLTAINGVNSCSAAVQITVALCTGFATLPVEEKAFTLFPNPSAGKFFIESQHGMENITVTIYSLSGALVRRQQLDAEHREIDLQNQPKGLYFCELIENEKILLRTKLIKE